MEYLTVSLAKYFEKQAQVLAWTYKLSIPQLSDAEICKKAEAEINNNKTNAVAQALAQIYNIHIPKISDTEICIRA
jgi:hypothetical protein